MVKGSGCEGKNCFCCLLSVVCVTHLVQVQQKWLRVFLWVNDCWSLCMYTLHCNQWSDRLPRETAGKLLGHAKEATHCSPVGKEVEI